MKHAKEIVLGFQQAMARDDWNAARKFLRDDLSFAGPFESFDRPEPYLEALKQLHPIVETVNMKRIFAEGDDVALFYDLVTSTPAGTAPIAEWHTVKGDQIAAIRVLFDARPFAALRRPGEQRV